MNGAAVAPNAAPVVNAAAALKDGCVTVGRMSAFVIAFVIYGIGNADYSVISSCTLNSRFEAAYIPVFAQLDVLSR